MATLNRTNGMIWIDKDSPYRLKYHIHDEDYTVETSVTYKCAVTDGESLPVGTIVKLIGGDKIAKAIFPVDLANVLGVILATEEAAAGASEVPVSVGKLGSIIIPKTNLADVFVSRDCNTLTEACETPAFATALLGLPVYWDCGYTDGTAYTAPTAGKLTIQTPSGFKYHQKTWSNDNTNIGYNNLPQVGNVINITAESIEIHLNFSTFDSTIEWFWPAIGAAAGKFSAAAGNQTFSMYHGLFAPTVIEGVRTTVKCPCKMTAQINNDDLDIMAHFNHNLANSYTTVTYSIPEDLTHVYISGEVIYGFNKN